MHLELDRGLLRVLEQALEPGQLNFTLDLVQHLNLQTMVHIVITPIVHIHIVIVGTHILAMEHLGLVMLLELNLLILDLTDRLFMSEALQGQTTEPIAHSLECGQLQTRVELTLCKLVNVEALAVHRTVLLSQLQ